MQRAVTGHSHMTDQQKSNSADGKTAVRRFLPHIVAVLALISLLIVSTLLWLEIKRRFPMLEPGGYFGVIQGAFPDQDEQLRFYVERPPEGDDLFFCILKDGWKPQIVSAVMRSGDSDNGWLLPVTVVGERAKLKFIGARTGPGSYRGSVTNLADAAEGAWTLDAVKDSPSVMSPNDVDDLRLWLRKRAELAEVEAAIREAEARVPQQKADIEKLTEFISERGQVQASADAKFRSAKDELAHTKRELEERQDRLRKLQERIEISQRVSPSGKLAMLSRESLERDARWAESILRTSGAETVAGLDVAVERGEKVIALKREIEFEKNSIFRLRFGAPGAAAPLPGTEDAAHE